MQRIVAHKVKNENGARRAHARHPSLKGFCCCGARVEGSIMGALQEGHTEGRTGSVGRSHRRGTAGLEPLDDVLDDALDII